MIRITTISLILATANIHGFAQSTKESKATTKKKDSLPQIKGSLDFVATGKNKDHYIGDPKKALVQLVKFSDLECPACQAANDTMKKALKKLDKEVKSRVLYVYKHYPLDSACNKAMQYSLHANACSLSYAARCAEAQGKFWEFKDWAFLQLNIRSTKKRYKNFSAAALEERMKQLGAKNPKAFRKCFEKKLYSKNVADDLALGKKLKVTGTPAFYLNGKKFNFRNNPSSVAEQLTAAVVKAMRQKKGKK